MAGITDFVDQGTSDRIRDFRDDASRSAASLEDQYLGDATEMPGFLKPTQGKRGQFPTTAGGNKTLMEAIDRRALGGYRANMSALKSEVHAQAIDHRYKRMINSAKLVNAEHQQNERARINRELEKANRRKARASVLGNILGIGGAVIGASVGGVGGASAGYHVGQGAGQMIGNQGG